jgi:hypothetical protein
MNAQRMKAANGHGTFCKTQLWFPVERLLSVGCGYPLGMAFLFNLLIALAAIHPVQAQELTTLPTYHWAYQYLQEIGLRHGDVSPMLTTMPLRRETVLAAAESVDQTSASGAERFWARRLREHLQVLSPRQSSMQIGAQGEGKEGRFGGESLRSRLAARSRFGLFPDRRLAFMNVIRVDQELLDDPRYWGKRWRGFSGYTEQAYLLVSFDKYLFKFGRDFLWWGKGYDATLLISDYSRPLDHLLFQIDFSRARLTYFAAKLNDTSLPDSLVQAGGINVAERYLAAGRLEIAIHRNRLRLGLGQMILQGGPATNVDWSVLNPFIIFHGEQINGGIGGNSFIAFDAVARPWDGFELYGQVLVDDWQSEKSSLVDQEPTEMGLVLGGEIADVFGPTGITLGVEYTRVANRTYNTSVDWEKFIHYNRPLAHFLGNDFDRWLLYGRAYVGWSTQITTLAEFRRRGEGRIEAPFERPWLNLPPGQSYHENFPSGVVEKSLHLRLEARWHQDSNFFVALHGDYSRYENFSNQLGRERRDISFLLRLWWERDWWIRL